MDSSYLADIAVVETNDDDDDDELKSSSLKSSETSNDNSLDDNSEKNEDDDDELEESESIESSSRSTVVVRYHSSPCLSVKCAPPTSDSDVLSDVSHHLPFSSSIKTDDNIDVVESVNKEDDTLTKLDDKNVDDTTAKHEINTTLSKVVDTDVVIKANPTSSNETTTSLNRNKDTTITELKTEEIEKNEDNSSQLTANDNTANIYNTYTSQMFCII